MTARTKLVVNIAIVVNSHHCNRSSLASDTFERSSQLASTRWISMARLAAACLMRAISVSIVGSPIYFAFLSAGRVKFSVVHVHDTPCSRRQQKNAPSIVSSRMSAGSG